MTKSYSMECPAGLAVLARTAAVTEKRSFGGKREWHLWVTGTVLYLTMFSITISFQVKGDPVCAIAGGQ
jgi:hypothetical protein